VIKRNTLRSIIIQLEITRIALPTYMMRHIHPCENWNDTVDMQSVPSWVRKIGATGKPSWYTTNTKVSPFGVAKSSTVWLAGVMGTLAIAIPGSRILECWPLLPILNPRIGSIPITGFWDCKNSLNSRCQYWELNPRSRDWDFSPGIGP